MCKRPEQEATPPSERVGPRAKLAQEPLLSSLILWLSEVTRRGRGAPADRRDPREHDMLVSVNLGNF